MRVRVVVRVTAVLPVLYSFWFRRGATAEAERSGAERAEGRWRGRRRGAEVRRGDGAEKGDERESEWRGSVKQTSFVSYPAPHTRAPWRSVPAYERTSEPARTAPRLCQLLD